VASPRLIASNQGFDSGGSLPERQLLTRFYAAARHFLVLRCRILK